MRQMRCGLCVVTGFYAHCVARNVLRALRRANCVSRVAPRSQVACSTCHLMRCARYVAHGSFRALRCARCVARVALRLVICARSLAFVTVCELRCARCVARVVWRLMRCVRQVSICAFARFFAFNAFRAFCCAQ